LTEAGGAHAVVKASDKMITTVKDNTGKKLEKEDNLNLFKILYVTKFLP
jgi:hypothetical protein